MIPEVGDRNKLPSNDIQHDHSGVSPQTSPSVPESASDPGDLAALAEKIKNLTPEARVLLLETLLNGTGKDTK
jgi:hypothetical protein